MHTRLILILDRSGSMRGLEDETIKGFNSMIEAQKKGSGSVNVTAVLFDDRHEMIYDNIDINNIPNLTREEYYVRGTTALLDAIGKTIVYTEQGQAADCNMKADDKTIIVITTDGMENASLKYDVKQIRRMIDQKKANGWEFIFLGANMDAVEEAARLGIGENRAVSYINDKEGIGKTYAGISRAVTEMRADPHLGIIGSEWKKEIEEDYRGRFHER